MALELFPGSQTVLYVNREGSYGAIERLNGADAFFTLSDSLTPAEERDVRPDRSGSPDHLERYRGRKSAEFEVTCLLLPSGSVTTEPDNSLLWENLFGRLSMNATGLEYVQATAHNWSLTIRRGIRTGGAGGAADYQEHVRGAIVNSGEISFGSQGQNGLATVTFRGMAKDWGKTGNTSVGTGYLSIASAATTFRVSSSRQLSVGSLIKVHTSTGGGSGIVVDTINHTSGVIAFSEALGVTLSSGRPIVPYNPVPTTAGSPIHARLGFVSLDGSATKIDCLGGRITYEDNRSLLNEEVGYDSASRVLRDDRRNITVSYDFLAKKDEIGVLLGRTEGNVSDNVQTNIGEGANKTVKVHMRKVEWDLTATDVPDQGMMRIAKSGRALGTNGNDSLKVRFL